MKLNVDAHIWCLGSFSERYVPGGYYDDMEIDKKLEIMSKIEGFTGLTTFYPSAPLPADPDKYVQKLADYGLKPSFVLPECFTDRKWKFGAFSTTEKHIRQEVINLFKEGIAFAKAINAQSVLLWPGHDGFDYPFQANYADGWKYLVETVQEIGEYDPSVKIAIEYKCKDPRQKQYVRDVGTLMMLLNDVGLDNVGGVIDTGHSLMAGENLAEALTILDSHNKLFQIHLNDNYKDADPDMILGAINFWEVLEFFYYLNKTDYEGWAAVDIIAGRDDRVKALDLTVKMTWKFKRFADKLCEHSDEIDDNLKGYRFTDNMEMLMDILFCKM
jgi:xylose isomerase